MCNRCEIGKGFVAREPCSGTCLHYYRARYYDPSTLFYSSLAFKSAVNSISTSASFGRRDTGIAFAV